MITEAKAEVLGALIGDKKLFKKSHRYGHYHGYDLSRYYKCVTSICLGADRDWGYHLSRLILGEYGVRGSIFFSQNEWVFECSSTRLFEDLTQFYEHGWRARTWRLKEIIFDSPEAVRERLVRGYFDADGTPYYNEMRNRLIVRATSVNLAGLQDMKRLLISLGIHPGIYRKASDESSWELDIARLSDLESFRSRIGFSITRKRAKLEEAMRTRG